MVADDQRLRETRMTKENKMTPGQEVPRITTNNLSLRSKKWMK